MGLTFVGQDFDARSKRDLPPLVSKMEVERHYIIILFDIPVIPHSTRKQAETGGTYISWDN